MKFEFHSIAAYNGWLKHHPDGCEIAVRHYLGEIGRQGRLNAFLEVYHEEAVARAVELDERRRRGAPVGKLHGVIVALKDVIAHKGHVMTASSKILEGFTSIYDATAVARLLAEDAIIIGRNNCDEFAMGSTNENSAFGPVLNGRDPRRVPGGSSGGSAVAVQAGMAMVSLGSDTGGSVRQPADFCGVVGLKPTYGRVSRYGLIAYASSFDQIGIFGRNVADVARVLAVISGADEFDSTVARSVPRFDDADLELGKIDRNRKYRIAWFREALDHPGLDPEIRAAIMTKLEQWRGEGHTVQAIGFDLLDYIVPAYYVLTTAEASSNLARFDGVRYGYRTPGQDMELTQFYKRTRSEGFGREVKRRILLGTFVLSAGYYDAYFTKAQQVRQRVVDHTNLIFNNFDILILPTAPTPAFELGEKMSDPVAMYLADIYTVYANLTGIPGISLPLFQHTSGMPFGIQAMTSRFKELSLLQFSHLMMQQ